MSADSLKAGDWNFRRAGAQVRGWADSLDWRAGTAFGAAAPKDWRGSPHLMRVHIVQWASWFRMAWPT